MKWILRLCAQRGEGTDARKRHKFPREGRKMLKEIKIILVLVIRRVECRETKKKKKTCRSKRDVSQNLRERGRNSAEMLRTWKALGGKPYAPAETWHCATIWLKLNSGCGCHPASWYFCFKDLLAVKEILLAIKKTSLFCFLLACPVSFPPPAFCKVSLGQKGCLGRNIPKELWGHCASPQHFTNPLLELQCFVPLLMHTSAFQLWSVTGLENRRHHKDRENPH